MNQEALTEERKDPTQDASLFRAGRKSRRSGMILQTMRIWARMR